MFFRIKKTKGKEYVYIVENEWQRYGSRQKVKSYTGRGCRFELKNNIDFIEHLKIKNVNDFIENNDFKKIIAELVEWELFKFGVDKENFSIDLENPKIKKNKKNVTILINDGYLCGHTLKNLVEFKPENDEQNDGYRLARAFVEAGIKVPQDVFVGLFGKLHKEK